MIHAHRIAGELKKALTGTEVEGEPPTCLLILSNGIFSSVAGEGKLYKQFCETKTIGDYMGRNVRASHPEDADYKNSKLRKVPFDYAFNHATHDVDKRKLTYVLFTPTALNNLLLYSIRRFDIVIFGM